MGQAESTERDSPSSAVEAKLQSIIKGLKGHTSHVLSASSSSSSPPQSPAPSELPVTVLRPSMTLTEHAKPACHQHALPQQQQQYPSASYGDMRAVDSSAFFQMAHMDCSVEISHPAAGGSGTIGTGRYCLSTPPSSSSKPSVTTIASVSTANGGYFNAYPISPSPSMTSASDIASVSTMSYLQPGLPSDTTSCCTSFSLATPSAAAATLGSSSSVTASTATSAVASHIVPPGPVPLCVVPPIAAVMDASRSAPGGPTGAAASQASGSSSVVMPRALARAASADHSRALHSAGHGGIPPPPAPAVAAAAPFVPPVPAAAVPPVLHEPSVPLVLPVLPAVLAVEDLVECLICCELPVAPVVTPCGHVHCLSCLASWRRRCERDSNQLFNCPSCRTVLHDVPLSVCTSLQVLLERVAGPAMARRQRDSGTSTTACDVLQLQDADWSNSPRGIAARKEVANYLVHVWLPGAGAGSIPTATRRLLASAMEIYLLEDAHSVSSFADLSTLAARAESTWALVNAPPSSSGGSGSGGDGGR